MAYTLGRHMQAGGNVQTESRSVWGHGVSGSDASCVSKLRSTCAPRPGPSSWPRRRRLMSAAAIGCSSRPLQTWRLRAPCSRWQHQSRTPEAVIRTLSGTSMARHRTCRTMSFSSLGFRAQSQHPLCSSSTQARCSKSRNRCASGAQLIVLQLWTATSTCEGKPVPQAGDRSRQVAKATRQGSCCVVT